MKKTKSKNLSKAQLKKLKGGLTSCSKTECIGDTCAGLGGHASHDHCYGSSVNTVNAPAPIDSGSIKPTKR